MVLFLKKTERCMKKILIIAFLFSLTFANVFCKEENLSIKTPFTETIKVLKKKEEGKALIDAEIIIPVVKIPIWKGTFKVEGDFKNDFELLRFSLYKIEEILSKRLLNIVFLCSIVMLAIILFIKEDKKTRKIKENVFNFVFYLSLFFTVITFSLSYFINVKVKKVYSYANAKNLTERIFKVGKKEILTVITHENPDREGSYYFLKEGFVRELKNLSKKNPLSNTEKILFCENSLIVERNGKKGRFVAVGEKDGNCSLKGVFGYSLFFPFKKGEKKTFELITFKGGLK